MKWNRPQAFLIVPRLFIGLLNKSPLGSVTTDTLYQEGQSVDPDDMQPGDMVFFDTYKYNGHIGIYAGDGQFIGAQSSTGVAYESLEDGYWGQTFNGNVQRIG